MDCPVCQVEASLSEGGYIREGETVYFVQVFRCRNPACSRHKQEIGKVKHQIKIQDGQPEPKEE